MVAIGGYAYWSLPRGSLIPGFFRVVLTFAAGLALPYLVSLVLLARRDGRAGLRLAFGASIVNAAWALPLAASFVLFAGFAMRDREGLHAISALVAGALLQIPLFAVARIALWRGRARSSAAAAASSAGGWLLAFLLPLAASGASWTYLNWQLGAFKERSAQAVRNDRAAQETLKMLQSCLTAFREAGYPARLDACPDAASHIGEAIGHRFHYLPALAGPDGRSGAYLLCAQPLEFRATGFETVVADGAGVYGAGAAEQATLDAPPTCASVLGVERAIAWCAYQHAAREPARGYPARLADIAPCVAARRALHEIGADRVTTDRREHYAYVADAPDAGGRVARFRAYRLELAGGRAEWIDDQLRDSAARIRKQDPDVDALPDRAVPERFMSGCAEGRSADCFLAGYEWQRKARQSARDDRDPSSAPLREAALQAFARGCALEHARSCAWLANEIEHGSGAERDVVRAASLYEQACALGEALGCRRAAEMFESGRKARPQTLRPDPPAEVAKADLARDVPRAIALYARACELDERDACFIAARLLAAGEGVEPDPEKALALFARLCDDGLALACARAAGLAAGREDDYLRRACALGEASACRYAPASAELAPAFGSEER